MAATNNRSKAEQRMIAAVTGSGKKRFTVLRSAETGLLHYGKAAKGGKKISITPAPAHKH